MDVGAIRALVFETNRRTHGVDAIVTRPAPNDAPILTRMLWETPEALDAPGATEVRRRGSRRIAVLAKSDVATCPLGTLIEAPERSDLEARTWRVDGFGRQEADQWRAIVIAIDEAREGERRINVADRRQAGDRRANPGSTGDDSPGGWV